MSLKGDPRHCLKVTFFQDKLSAPELCMGHARDTDGDMPMFSIMPGFPWLPDVPFFTAMLGIRQQRCHWCQECPIYDEFDWNMPGITTLIVLATLVLYAVVAGLYTGLVPCQKHSCWRNHQCGRGTLKNFQTVRLKASKYRRNIVKASCFFVG